jgi:hypothetical protein
MTCICPLPLPTACLSLPQHTTLSLQVLSKLQAQLQQGPLPCTTGTELMAKGGSYSNGGGMLLLAASQLPAVFVVNMLHHANSV